MAPFSVRVQNDLGYDFVCPQLTACRRAIDLPRDWLQQEAAAD